MKARFARASLGCLAGIAVFAASASAKDVLRSFDVPSGDAEDSIALFSLQSQKLILAPSDALVGVKMPAVRGKMSPAEALAILLLGTSLEVASDDGRTLVLRKRLPQPSPAGVPGQTALPPAAQRESVLVTGYRASLANATNTKRAATSFTDAIFAEDIGKFPDANLAESLNRIPGVTITRENTGEGIGVEIRGLGQNFTKILINGDPIAVASTGPTDGTNSNREIDLNMFPAELFTQLSVLKSPMADQVEGGAAGSVTMRVLRPFDRPGFHLRYSVQATDQSSTNLAIGKRGELVFSDTQGALGLLIGLVGVQNNVMVTGWEDGNAGWVAPNLPSGSCGTGNSCSQFGGGSWSIPNVVPSGVYVPVPSGFALSPGYAANVVGGTRYFPVSYPVNQAMLIALNPGLVDASCSAASNCTNQAMTRLSNALLPRLGRPTFEKGSRDRYNGVVSLEFRPLNELNVYLDAVFGKSENHLNRTDVGWGVRGGASATQMIPANLTLASDWLQSSVSAGLGGAIKTGTFYNATFGIEARDYRETTDFINFNPGISWQASDLFRVDLQANYSSSHFFRRNPTVMVSSCTATAPATGIDNCPNGPPHLGTVLQFDATGTYPTEAINVDLNDPRNYAWNLGRVNLVGEKRWTTTQGAHLDVAYGGESLAVKVGAAYDVAYRLIKTLDDSVTWQNEICGDYPSTVVLGPNSSMAGCTGQTAPAPVGWTNTYTGWGTGSTAGMPPLTYKGSLVPTSALTNYLKPGPDGFVTVDYDKIFAASDYWRLFDKAVAQLACVPRCSPANIVEYPTMLNSTIEERTAGLYAKADGRFELAGRKLRYDLGLRWVETRQFIISPTTTVDARNATLSDGGRYTNYQTLSSAKYKYHAWLPSASLVYEIADDFQARASVSRTMTRPNPGDMRATIDFGDPTVANATLGNPKLKSYFSNNIDLGAEFYTGGEGYIGTSLFRKSISGFTNQLVTQRTFSYLAQYGITYNTLTSTQRTNYNTNGGPSGIPCFSDAGCANQPVLVNQQVNLPGSEIIRGVELDVVQPLDKVTEDYLGTRGFGVTGNFTIIGQRSTGSVPTYAVGVAPYQFNTTVYYEADDAMVRLSYNWNDTSYASSSNNQGICLPAQPSGAKPPGCPGGAYLFTKAYGQADFSSSVKLKKLFGALASDPELTFDIQNVFDAKLQAYDQLASAAHYYYSSGQTYMLGIRGSF
ncbi:MAG: TonB-dependent receptor [Rhizomicrobium sp.]|nr:TonB-dependent receptor [Rhizomicrobium sp.]